MVLLFPQYCESYGCDPNGFLPEPSFLRRSLQAVSYVIALAVIVNGVGMPFTQISGPYPAPVVQTWAMAAIRLRLRNGYKPTVQAAVRFAESEAGKSARDGVSPTYHLRILNRLLLHQAPYDIWNAGAVFPWSSPAPYL